MKSKITLFLVIIVSIQQLSAQVQTVVSGIVEGKRIYISGTTLYYSALDEIYFFDVTDPNPTPSVLISGLSNPSGMEILNNSLYVAQFDADNIIRLDLSMSNPVPELVTSFSTNHNMMVIVDNIIYYTNTQVGAVLQYDITTNMASGLIPGLNGAVGITHKEGLLYIAAALEGKIYTFDLSNPSAGATEIISGLDRPLGIDFKGDELYIADNDNDRIVKFNSNDDPLVIEDVVTNTNNPRDIAFYQNTMYIIEASRILKYELPLSIDEYDFSITRLYPNPTNDYIKISGLKNTKDYIIYDHLGRVLNQGEIAPNQQIDVSAYESGTYFIAVDDYTKRFIKN